MPCENSATFKKWSKLVIRLDLDPKISIFSRCGKAIYKWFLILFRAYSSVLESFWVGFVPPYILRVQIRQYFTDAQNWPHRRYGSTLTPEIRYFSSLTKVIN